MSIELGDTVRWTPTGELGTVLGLTTEPSAIVVFPHGRHTIGLSKLRKTDQEVVEQGAIERAFTLGAESVLDQIATEPWAREIDLTKWARMFGVAPGSNRGAGDRLISERDAETGVNARPVEQPTPVQSSGEGASRTVESSGAGRTPTACAAHAVRLLEAVDLSEEYGWDRRKVILDVYHEGFSADYVAEDDVFNKRYSGLMAVARWAGREAIGNAQMDLGDPMNWSAR